MGSIKEELNDIKERLIRIEKACELMTKHIHFIERTYSAVETPLSFIKNKVEGIIGIQKTNPLPSFEDRDPIECLTYK